MNIESLLTAEFSNLPEIVRAHARARPDAIAVADPETRLTWAEFDSLADRIASRLQREGVGPGGSAALAGFNSAYHVAAWLGVLRTGAVAGLITYSATGEQMAAMIADTGARHLFLDAGAAASLEGFDIGDVERIAMDGSDAGTSLLEWMDPEGCAPDVVDIRPESSFNIIYSSGTTGVLKGIVHSHSMRW